MPDPSWISIADVLTPGKAGETSLLSIVGAPVRLGGITPGRCDLAPQSIRRALERVNSYHVETDLDLRSTVIADWGDLPVAGMSPKEAFDPLRAAISEILQWTSGAVVVLGGDNSITRPAFQALAAGTGRTGLLTLDAHHDVRDTSFGLNNGNPIKALLNDGVPGSNVVQAGIQPFANSRVYTQVARDSGVRFFTTVDIQKRGMELVVKECLDLLTARCDQIYVDFDLDVLERSAVPSTAGSRPGGLAPREVLGALRILGGHGKVRMMDIVEHDPERDVAEITSLMAATAVATFFSAVLARP